MSQVRKKMKSPSNWPHIIVKDNFLSEKHFNAIKNIKFDTKPNEWDIYKHKRYDNGKDYVFGIHSDSRDKLLSAVIYISPEVNEGTWLYDNKKGDNPIQVEWLPNRNFIFCRNDNTWHSYKADGKTNRLALVYNLRSDKKWFKK